MKEALEVYDRWSAEGKPQVLLLFGAGHVSQPLAVMGRQLGFRVIVADARPIWATEERSPDVDELIVAWPEKVLERVELDRRTYVALLNHERPVRGGRHEGCPLAQPPHVGKPCETRQ